MKRILNSLSLGSALLGVIVIAACSSSTDKPIGTGGTAGKHGLNAGAANGGSSVAGFGGVAIAGGTGGTADSSIAGAPGNGGNGGAAGNVSAAGAATAGASGLGSGGNAGAAGAARSSAAGNGASAGAAGNVGAAGAAKAGAAGAGATSNVGAAGATGATAVVRWPFDSLDGWTIKPADSFIPLRIDAAVGTTFTASAGIATLTVPFGLSSNTALQTTAVQRSISPAINMTGLTATVNIRWVSGGVGSATEGGFDVYLIPSDGDWTEGFAGRGEFTLADRGASAFKQFAYAIPAADAVWDPSSIQQLQVRIDSKYWDGPTFDYTTAVFQVDSISY